MAKKYYAVAKGKTPGIYFTWDDCKNQVEHFPGAVYKGFQTLQEAESFVRSAGVELPFQQMTIQELQADGIDCQETTQETSTEKHAVAYVDGSYDDSQKRYAYGCAIVLEQEVIELNGSDDLEEYVGMRNVAGEILGSEKAIAWAAEHGYESITIYYDYEGIEKWANNIWKANKTGTQAYKAYVEKMRAQLEITFCKVKAHTGVTYNELADKLAKSALGIE